MSVFRSPRIWLGAATALILLIACAVLFLAIQTWEPFLVPQIVEVAPPPGAMDIAPSSPITVTFRNAMDTTRDAFVISPPVSGNLKWADDRTLVFSPTTSLPLSTTLTITITQAARSQLFRPLEHAFQWSFSTVAPPRVVSSTPAPEARFVYANKGLTVRFSREMDRASVESHLSVTPPLAQQRLSWNGLELLIGGVIRPGSTYRVALSKGAQDRAYGLGTERDLVWTFTATVQYPLLALTSTGCCTLLRAEQPAQLSLQLVNVSRLDARLDSVKPDALFSLLAPSGDAASKGPTGNAYKGWSVDPHVVPDKYAQFALPVDALPPGLYSLTLDTPETIPETRLLVVSQTALTVKRADQSVLVWATSMTNGQPVADLSLTLYDERGNRVGGGQTDKQGLYEGTLTGKASVLYVVGATEADYALTADNWQDGIEPWQWPELQQAGSGNEPADNSAVQVQFDRSSYIQGDTISATITAHELADTPAQWTLLGTDYAFEGKGGDYDFAPVAATPGPLRELATGQGMLDGAGQLAVQIPPITGNSASQRVTLQVMVIRSGEPPVSGAASTILHSGRFYVGARPLSYIASPSERAVFEIQTFDPRGEALGKTPLEYNVQRLEWNCGVEEDDRNRKAYRCKETRSAVAAGRLTTDANGQYQLSFAPSQSGGYALVLEGRDARGNNIIGETRLWVVSPDRTVSWPFPDGKRLDLVSDKKGYVLGDMARILVQSPYPRATALVTVERTNILWHGIVSLQSNSAVVVLPILDTYAPDVLVSVVLIPPDAPTLRVGYVRLRVQKDGASQSDSPALISVKTGSSLALPR